MPRKAVINRYPCAFHMLGNRVICPRFSVLRSYLWNRKKNYSGFKFVKGLHPGISFEQFVKVICNTPDAISDGHFRSQYVYYTFKGKTVFNKLLPFTNLNAALLNLNLFDVKIPRENIAPRNIGIPKPSQYAWSLLYKRYANDYALKRFLENG